MLTSMDHHVIMKEMLKPAGLRLLVITAIIGALTLDVSLPALAQDYQPPAAPTGLTAPSVSHDSVTVTWDDPDDDSITGYQILRRNRATDDPGVFHTIEDDTGTAATSYLNSDVEPETPYVYRIKAINDRGLSAQSTYVDADTPAPPVPDKPTGLAGTVAHDSVSLNWDDPDDDTITGYRILRRNRAEDDTGVFHTIEDDTGSSGTSYTDTGVAAETRYVYRIKAINNHGLSERNSWLDADTPEAPAETQEGQQQSAPPAAHTGPLTAATHDQVLLSWDDPDDSIT